MNSAAPKLMAQSEFAAHRGVRKSAVSNWKKRGLLVFAEGEGGQMFVDVERTEARLNANLDPARGRPKAMQSAAAEPALPLATPRQANELGDVRTDLLREQRIGQRLKNAKEAGQLVPVEEYERRSQELGRTVYERVMAVVRDQAEALAAVREPREVVALLTGEFDRVFSDLANGMDAEEADENEDVEAADEDGGAA